MTEPKRRPGRPTLDNPRAHTIRYRVTADELATAERAAAAKGQTVTEYARAVLLAAAKRVP